MKLKSKKTIEYVVEGYIIQNSQILLIYHKGLKLWLPPGGHIMKNEIPEEALTREIKEETGLEVEIVKKITSKKNLGVGILAQPTHIQLESIQQTHYHIDFVFLCRIVKSNSKFKKNPNRLRFFTIQEIENLKNIPEEVKVFANKFIKKQRNRNLYKLPVLKEILLEHKSDFSNISLLIIQHIKKNSTEFIKLLNKQLFKEIIVIGKSYSHDPKALKEISKYSKVIIPSFLNLENLEIIKKVVKKFLNKKKQFVCLDMGGYFSKYFQQNNNTYPGLIGIIEETKNGIWFDNKNIKLKFPLLSVASSDLKKYAENYFVAKAIIRNSENILINTKYNQSLSNKKILILGYGGIGYNISKILNNEARITLYDNSPTQLLKAKIDGFNIIEDLNNLSDYEIIIGVTGKIVLNQAELLNLKNGVFLINGSTRKKEFDMDSISKSVKKKTKNKMYTKYELVNSKRIYLLADGFPINFLNTESIPEYILDLIYSEIFLLIELLTKKNFNPGFYPIEKHFYNIEETISKSWLKYWKN